jgi:hypothetical protein
VIDELFELVLAASADYTTQSSPAMDDRRESIKSARVLINDSIAALPGAGEFAWQTEYGGQVGGVSPVPWIRLFDARFSERATDGFYICWLFSGTGDAVYLTLNQGTSEFRSGKWRPIREGEVVAARSDAARAAVAEWPQSVVESGVASINLGSAALGLKGESFQRIRNYEEGHIAGFRYPAGGVPSDDVLLADLRALTPLLARLYDPARPVGEVQKDGEVTAAAQGRTSDAKLNKAIEMRAMDVVEGHYSSLGWDCKDVSAGRPYDFELTRGEEEVHVEVKGTVGVGAAVNLTMNEVRHAGDFPDCALAVLSGVTIQYSDEGLPIASGGTLRIWQPWIVDHGRLLATDYRYDLREHSGAVVL